MNYVLLVLVLVFKPWKFRDVGCSGAAHDSTPNRLVAPGSHPTYISYMYNYDQVLLYIIGFVYNYVVLYSDLSLKIMEN